MNIFVLDLIPERAAQYHCDKHVVKMILETAQILSTVVVGKIPQAREVLYKPTHKSHPCVIWASQSVKNMLWLASLGFALCEEFEYRYGKKHKSEKIILNATILGLTFPRIKYPEVELTPFTQAMPEKYRNDNPVKAYRDYYKNEKKHLLTYTKRENPPWID